MSAVDAAQRAARVTDPISHSLVLLGMIGGMVLGAIVGVIMIGAAIATGGALLIALAACAAVGAVAMGGLSGGQLVRGLKTACGLPDPQTGVLGPIGSPNVRIGNLFATRMGDPAIACDGIMTLLHPIPIPAVPIAEGALTVRINNLAAARVTSKLFCGAQIKDGDPTVMIGGPTERDPNYIDPEEALTTVLNYALIGSLIGVAILSFAIGGVAALAELAVALAGFYVANEILGIIGDALGPGYRDILQGAFGIITIIAAGVKAVKEFGKIGETARENAAKEKAAREQAEQAAREQAAREQAAREEAARKAAEEEAKAKAAREQAARDRLAQRREAARQQKLKEAIEQAEKKGKLDDLDPADKKFIEDDPTGRRKELAYDPDTKSFKPQEARAALQAENDGVLDGPVRRAFNDRGESGGDDIIDGNGKGWDIKDASDGADNIVSRAAPQGGQPGENVLVDCSDLTPEKQRALEQDVKTKRGDPPPPGSGDIRFTPKR